MRKQIRLGFTLTTAAALVLVGSAVSAPPAAAASIALTLDCLHDVTLNADVGDTLVITLAATCPSNLGFVSSSPGLAFGFLRAEGVTDAGDYDITDPTKWYVYSDGSGQTTITATVLGHDAGDPPNALSVGSVMARLGPDDGQTEYWIYYGGPVSTSNEATGNHVPPSWFQSIGRQSSTSLCDAGWHPSWARWMNAGTGGWVCDRETFWDGSAWSYRSVRK